ncbi:MAG: hypothetical protein ACHQIM_20445, partial [Sphingobacteriales bacterium]
NIDNYSAKLIIRDANHIVANLLILAKAHGPLFTHPSLERDGNELQTTITFIAVGFNRRVKRFQLRL